MISRDSMGCCTRRVGMFHTANEQPMNMRATPYAAIAALLGSASTGCGLWRRSIKTPQRGSSSERKESNPHSPSPQSPKSPSSEPFSLLPSPPSPFSLLRRCTSKGAEKCGTSSRLLEVPNFQLSRMRAVDPPPLTVSQSHSRQAIIMSSGPIAASASSSSVRQASHPCANSPSTQPGTTPRLSKRSRQK